MRSRYGHVPEGLAGGLMWALRGRGVATMRWMESSSVSRRFCRQTRGTAQFDQARVTIGQYSRRRRHYEARGLND
eukprot:6172239-Pleurochrysis_carterae.AAC.1